MSQTCMDTELIGQRMDLGFLIQLPKGVRKYQSVVVFVKLRASALISVELLGSTKTLRVEEMRPLRSRKRQRGWSS